MDEIDALRIELTAGLLQAARQWKRIVQEALNTHAISEACAAPLLWVGRLGGGVRQVNLAAQVGIEGPSLVRLIDQLCAAGLVVRKDDPVDRRAKSIWLTQSGEELAERIEALLVDLRAHVLRDISKSDLEVVLRVFQALDAAAAREQPLAAVVETEPMS